ncbi:MAG: hypothetical protein ABSD41_03145 [Candidatus Bathyarchaeia archaeon]
MISACIPTKAMVHFPVCGIVSVKLEAFVVQFGIVLQFGTARMLAGGPLHAANEFAQSFTDACIPT